VGKVDYSGSFSTADKGDYTTGGGSKYYNTAYDDVRREASILVMNSLKDIDLA